MRILFCNVTWMKHYNGINDSDTVGEGGGSYINKHKTGAEIYNFQDYNGFCYGYVSGKGEIHIERLEDVKENAVEADNVLVVWTAKPSANSDNVIVGWYKNAILYRYEQTAEPCPNVGRDLYYFIKAKASDCFLLPESERKFIVPRASELGKGMGMGQSNYWFADSEYAKEKYTPEVISYINNYDNGYVNRVYTKDVLTKVITKEDFAADNIYNVNDLDLISEEGSQLIENADYYKALLYFNTILEKEENADYYYSRGLALRGLNCFDEAIEAFEKVIDIEGKTEDTLGTLVYLYEITNRNEKVLQVCDELLKLIDPKQTEVICEVYSVMSDTYARMGNTQEAIKSLDFIISNTKDKNLQQYSKETKNNYLKEM